MILFVLGLVVGGVVGALLVRTHAQRQLKTLSHDLALLQARLRTLVRLAEAGMVMPDTVEAANVLNEIHDMVSVSHGHQIRERINVIAAEDDDDGAVPSVFT